MDTPLFYSYCGDLIIEMTTPEHEVTCAFCFAKDMDQCLRMHCGDTSCYPCYKHHVDSSNEVECLKCRKTFKSVDPDLLEKVVILIKPMEAMPNLCGKCEKEPATIFCVPCQLLLCKDHLREDDELAQNSKMARHFQVPIDTFLCNKDHYLQQNCNQHKDHVTTKICTNCNQVFCDECDTGMRCTGAGQYMWGTLHAVSSLPMIAESTKIRIKEKQKLLADKINQLSLVQKEIVSGIEAVNKLALSKQEEIESVVSEQIKHITQEGERAKSEVEKMATYNNSKYESKLAEAHSSDEKAISYMCRLAELNDIISPGRLVEKFSNIEKGLDQLLEENITSDKLPIIYMHNIPEKEEYFHVKCDYPPTSMEFKRQFWRDFCFTVRWTSNDELVIASEAGLEILYEGLNKTKSIQLSNCEDLVEFRDEFIVIRQLPEKKKVISVYSRSLIKRKDLVKFSSQGSIIKSHIAATFDKLIASDGSEGDFHVWTFDGQLLYTIHEMSLCYPSGVHVTNDGGLLISGSGSSASVAKFQIGDKSYSKLWTSEKLAYPEGICEDQTGLIYIAGDYQWNKSIYILSSTVRMQTK